VRFLRLRTAMNETPLMEAFMEWVRAQMASGWKSASDFELPK
jgi:hypothetical protein